MGEIVLERNIAKIVYNKDYKSVSFEYFNGTTWITRFSVYLRTGYSTFEGTVVLKGIDTTESALPILVRGSNVLTIYSTTMYFNGDVGIFAKDFKITGTPISLLSHGSRHGRLDQDPIPYQEISVYFDSDLVTCDIGLNGTLKETTVYSVPNGWYNLLPLCYTVEISGVSATETITVYLRAEYEGGYITLATVTTTGSDLTVHENVNWANFVPTIANFDGKRISRIYAEVSSDQSTTAATVKVRVFGIRT